MNHQPRTIAIVGAGFSGTAVAINLLQQHCSAPLRVILVDGAPAGRGVAYARRDYLYLLNVPAGRMSADAAEPDDFLNFARARYPRTTAHDFLPRSLYGDYLDSRLNSAERNAAQGARVERVRGTARSLERNALGDGYRVWLADGRSVSAEQVVLALGNPPSAALPGSEQLSESAYVADPWTVAPGFRPGERVLVVGTGLTMADIVTAGASASRRDMRVHAISRHGLMPLSQSALGHEHVQVDTRRLLEAASFSTRSLLHTIRRLAEETVDRDSDWRELMNVLRGVAPQLWQRMPARERQRFLRHVRPYWDTHRHRLPHQTFAELQSLRDEGKLSVQAGRIVALEHTGKQVRVVWRPRGFHAPATLVVDRVFNCTGPNYDPRRSHDPLMLSLLNRGLAVPDTLGLGLRTGAFGALLDAHGRPADDLYYIGPMLRPEHWESTAVPELRGHAARLAQHLAGAVLMQTVASL